MHLSSKLSYLSTFIFPYFPIHQASNVVFFFFFLPSSPFPSYLAFCLITDGPLTLMIPNLASACTRACMFLERNGIGNGNNEDEVSREFLQHNSIEFILILILDCFYILFSITRIEVLN